MKIKSYDKHLLLVKSEKSKATNLDLVSFHKSFKLVFNQNVIAHTCIKKAMYATFYADVPHRRIYIKFYEEKISSDARKVFDPMFSKISDYLAINIKRLLWSHEICLLGAFEYEWWNESKTLVIHF